MTRPLCASEARTIGHLGGDPVQSIMLDAANHPLRPPASYGLNDTVWWVGWRGRWAHARSAVSARLERVDLIVDLEEVWRTLSHPPHFVDPYPREEEA